MKKLAIAASLIAACGLASAMDVGVRGTYNGESRADMVGVTVGKKFGAFGAEAAFDRTTRGDENVNRFSVMGTYDFLKISDVTFVAKAGAVHYDPSAGDNGGALVAGIGGVYPLTKKVSLVADYAYARGADRVARLAGHSMSAGVKFAF